MLYPSSLGNNVKREYALAIEQATLRLIIMVDSCLVEFFHVVMMINSFLTMKKGKGFSRGNKVRKRILYDMNC